MGRIWHTYMGSGLGTPKRGQFEWDPARIIPYPSWISAYGNREDTSRALFEALLGLPPTAHDDIQLHNFAPPSLPFTFLSAFPQFAKRKWIWLASQGDYYYKWERWREAHNDFMLGEQPLGSFFTNIIPDDADECAYVEAYCNVREWSWRDDLCSPGGATWAGSLTTPLIMVRKILLESAI
jgi:hypothetical protein